MTTSVNGVKNIDKHRKLCVYGYIHESESKYKQQIPTGIIYIIILFYGNDADEWDKTYIALQHKMIDRTITVFTPRGSSYGSRIVDSGIFKWKFRIEEMENGVEESRGGKYMIGIWKGKDKDDAPPTDTFFTEGGCGYGLEITGAVLTNSEGYIDDTDVHNTYGVECKNGTIIEMILDMNKLTLGFIIDGVDYGKAFDVDKGKYRAAVFMVQKSDSITLLD